MLAKKTINIKIKIKRLNDLLFIFSSAKKLSNVFELILLIP